MAKKEKVEAEAQVAESKSKRIGEEVVAEIRALRAETNDKGGPVHSHLALAQKFGVGAGTISQIVRNRTYKNENYTPVHDTNG